MNKLELQHPALIYPSETQSEASALRLADEILAANIDPNMTGRLLILLPPDLNYNLATPRIWELAMATARHIQLLGLCKGLAEEPRLRRELVTMSALIRDARVCAETKVEIGTSWVEAVKNNIQPGDMIVCFAEQSAGIFHRPLSQILRSNLSAPIYILSGLTSQTSTPSSWLSQFMVWTGSLGIIAGSAFLQFQITASTQNWAQTTLMILSIVGEIGLIWGWNSLFT